MEKIAYDCKYTAGSYADGLMSLPIGATKYLCKGVEKLCKEKTPDIFNWNKIQEKSPVYKTREKLRDDLDTEPGVKFLQSNLIVAVPFVLSGMPVAELTNSLIEKYSPEMPELGKHITTSVCTLAAQMMGGYNLFMANEIRVNKEKYLNEKGKLSIKKIGTGLGRAIKAFLSFDIPYCTGKISLQTNFLLNGKDPWKASGIADGIATPCWYTLAIPLGLHNGIIETKETKTWKKEKKISLEKVAEN